jgi:DNA mismatch repair protein MutL
VHFIVRAKRTLLDIPAEAPGADSRQRTALILGKEILPRLYPLDAERAVLRLTGFAADPEEQAGDARNLYVYVNGRAVRDRLLQRAVLEGYRSLLPHGRYPTAVIMLELPPEAVDVNVHPQKFDVRFTDGQAVFSFVQNAIAEVLAKTPWLDRGGARLPSEVIARQAARVSGFSRVNDTSAVQAAAGWQSLFEQKVRPALDDLRSNAAEPAPPETPALLPGGFFSRLRVLAQFSNLYILCQGEGELVIVDQHAAHERITFEKLLNAWEAGEVARQRLLFPITLEARPDVVQLIEENAAALERLGLELQAFGEATLALKAIPAVAGERKARGLVEEVVAELGDARGVASAEFAHALLARIACHSAVRSGDALSIPEMEALLQELDSVDCAIRCPHGRPVVARVRSEQIGRWFERP